MDTKISKEILGLNIKKYRKSKKMTQQQLGDLIFKTESTIRKYEKGLVEIPADVVFNLANALKTNVWDLIGIDRALILEKFDPDNIGEYMKDANKTKERNFYTSILRNEGYCIPITSSEYQEILYKNRDELLKKYALENALYTSMGYNLVMRSKEGNPISVFDDDEGMEYNLLCEDLDKLHEEIYPFCVYKARELLNKRAKEDLDKMNNSKKDEKKS